MFVPRRYRHIVGKQADMAFYTLDELRPALATLSRACIVRRVVPKVMVAGKWRVN